MRSIDTAIDLCYYVCMKAPIKINKNNDVDPNFIKTSTADFVQYYNQHIPESFPRVSQKLLEQFRVAYPALFNGKDGWMIDKHRKKLVDWLASHHGNI